MKSKRQQVILDIVEREDVETQEQLLLALKDLGVSTTPATISRDIKELGLVKELTPGGFYKYAVSQRKVDQDYAGRLRAIFREGVLSFDLAQNLIVLKTMPGLAHGVGSAIDNMEVPEVVGTVAGDDTALLVMRTAQAAEDFCTQVRQMLN